MELIKNHLIKLENKAKEIFYLKKIKYSISYTLKSATTIGLFEAKENGKKITLFFNKSVIDKSGEKKYLSVVTHEFSHMITYLLYGNNVQAHGKEWKNIMKLFGEKKASATTSKFAKEIGQVKCKCKCKTHWITKNRATRIKNGCEYICQHCNKKLKVFQK